MIKAIIFDMDGVLVDNMKVHTEVFDLFSHKYERLENAAFDSRFAGMSNSDIMSAIFTPEIIEKYGAEALGREKEQMYRDYYADKVQPAEGLVNFLEELREAGIKCAVGSSGEKLNVDMVLDRTGIRKYFSAIVNGDMVTRHKPEPDIFLLAAEMIGMTPENCLVMEDSLAGIQAAHSARMHVIALTTTFDRERLKKENPDMIVSGFTELSFDKVAEKFGA